MKVKLILITFLLFAVCNFAFSQKMLLVKKNGTAKNEKYFVGDEIFFKYCDEDGNKTKVKGKINIIDVDYIILNYDQEYEISKIKTVYVVRKGVEIAQTVVGLSGVAYLLLTGVNSLLGNAVDKHNVGYGVAGGAIGVSAATIPLNKRRYKLNKPDKYSILVLDYDF
jgi:hypothetical protein